MTVIIMTAFATFAGVTGHYAVALALFVLVAVMILMPEKRS